MRRGRRRVEFPAEPDEDSVAVHRVRTGFSWVARIGVFSLAALVAVYGPVPLFWVRRPLHALGLVGLGVVAVAVPLGIFAASLLLIQSLARWSRGGGWCRGVLIAALLAAAVPSGSVALGSWATRRLPQWERSRVLRRGDLVVEAVRRYTNQRHGIPTSLDDLVPDFLPAIPKPGTQGAKAFEYYPHTSIWFPQREHHASEASSPTDWVLAVRCRAPGGGVVWCRYYATKAKWGSVCSWTRLPSGLFDICLNPLPAGLRTAP